MSVELICASHTPLMDFIRPPAEVEAAARGTFARLAERVRALDPELIVVFAPDHFNGFFYDLMPSFCLGVRAAAAEDWDIGHGKLNVPEGIALELVKSLQQQDIDIAYSYRMQADHGFNQSLELLAGGMDQYPVIPIFINSAARPMPPCRRAVALGEAVGRFLKGRAERILIMGSGGLSHDPPTPQMGAVPPEIEEFLIGGRNPSSESRQARQERVLANGRKLAAGESNGLTLPLNPAWDQGLLQSFADADFARFRAMTDEEIAAEGGRGGHEIRCWIAGFAALQAAGGAYQAETEYYHAIDQWLAGMALMTAHPKAAAQVAA